MKRTFSAGLLAAIMAGQSAPALAEIVDERDDGFITRHTVTVDASPTETWLALISPSRWWDKQHTWSSDSANLKLTPQAGGCFCETIPEVDEPDRFTLEGSVEHMRVIQAYPEQALRMVGALGPLQSEPVTGVLTIALSEVKRDGETSATKIVWEYNVGGPMRYEVPVISKAVDGVMALQVAGLGTFLGVLENEAPRGDAQAPEEDDAAPDEAVTIDPDAMLDVGAAEASEPEPEEAETPSVDEAFGDLSAKEPGGLL